MTPRLGPEDRAESWFRVRDGRLIICHRQVDCGSVSRYSQGCRCDECRAANAAYKRRWRREYAGRTGKRLLKGRFV